MEVEKRYDYEIKAFGKRLKEIRKKKGLIQLDLEVRCGLDRTDVSRIENGLKNIEFFTIVKLAEALSIPISDFFNYSLIDSDSNQKSSKKKQSRKKI